MNTLQAIDDFQMDALLEAIYHTYHYDFRSYARASLRRGLERASASLRLPEFEQLLHDVVTDPEVFASLLRYFTVRVSELFRDPDYYRAIRDSVLPYLATHPFPRLWVAGCGAGEEAHSLAIVLHEEGLLDRSFIYATDIDATSLSAAAAATYSADVLGAAESAYRAAGGRRALADYFRRASASSAVLLPMLRNRILFADHSLSTDSAFAEVHLVSCRNVLIYFDEPLQRRAIGLFREALCPRGFLGLGAKESLQYSTHAAAFQPFRSEQRIYRLR